MWARRYVSFSFFESLQVYLPLILVFKYIENEKDQRKSITQRIFGDDRIKAKCRLNKLFPKEWFLENQTNLTSLDCID
jgi:hypothetical protein